KTRKTTFLKFTEVAVDLSDKKLQNRVYIYVRSFRKATICRLCLKKSKDLWVSFDSKSNNELSELNPLLNEQKFLDEGPIFKKQEYNSKLKDVWWGVDKFKSCCFFKKLEVLILDMLRSSDFRSAIKQHSGQTLSVTDIISAKGYAKFFYSD
ncbi:hypothetical protein BpHYR1_017205, partial [Brachionus plicatilis]